MAVKKKRFNWSVLFWLCHRNPKVNSGKRLINLDKAISFHNKISQKNETKSEVWKLQTQREREMKDSTKKARLLIWAIVLSLHKKDESNMFHYCVEEHTCAPSSR